MALGTGSCFRVRKTQYYAMCMGPMFIAYHFVCIHVCLCVCVCVCLSEPWCADGTTEVRRYYTRLSLLGEKGEREG